MAVPLWASLRLAIPSLWSRLLWATLAPRALPTRLDARLRLQRASEAANAGCASLQRHLVAGRKTQQSESSEGSSRSRPSDKKGSSRPRSPSSADAQLTPASQPSPLPKTRSARSRQGQTVSSAPPGLRGSRSRERSDPRSEPLKLHLGFSHACVVLFVDALNARAGSVLGLWPCLVEQGRVSTADLSPLPCLLA